MTLLSRIELGSGAATGLCGLTVAIVALLRTEPGELSSLSLAEFLMVLSTWVTPPLLVAIGSYFHVWRWKAWGYVLLMIGGLLVLGGSLMILAADSQGHEVERLIMLVPGGLTAATMVVAMLVRGSEKRKIRYANGRS